MAPALGSAVSSVIGPQLDPCALSCWLLLQNLPVRGQRTKNNARTRKGECVVLRCAAMGVCVRGLWMGQRSTAVTQLHRVRVLAGRTSQRCCLSLPRPPHQLPSPTLVPLQARQSPSPARRLAASEQALCLLSPSACKRSPSLLLWEEQGVGEAVCFAYLWVAGSFATGGAEDVVRRRGPRAGGRMGRGCNHGSVQRMMETTRCSCCT